ncbi:acetylglutamate kinase [Marinilongibacter aquaticus]|uniref:acetylglutamate kinase n=1 Tax=Marinilongibacter aquaticus TaxID=2975157 RepID=UPI0021BD8158|nr:acetylglutamate kinase [Marinilongibacter aquaticus]UBM60645.1 acetylglutamate kinase [Marinilongibacter aquaticus]
MKEKVYLIKIGGNVIDNTEKLDQFLNDFSALEGHKILVHGGGKIATRVAKDLGVETQMVNGRRITDAAMRDVVTMVYGGLVNKNIVGQLQSLGTNALGLSGADAGVILAAKRPVKEVDYGFVGDVEKVDGEFIGVLLKQGITPVFAPLSFNPEFGLLNTNADTQTSEIARALAEDYEVHVVFCFEKKGVLMDAFDDESVIPVINLGYYYELRTEGVIFDGMIPKLDNAFEAVKSGVKTVTICEAGDLKMAVENQSAGTIIQL